jgi:hypothetical protein
MRYGAELGLADWDSMRRGYKSCRGLVSPRMSGQSGGRWRMVWLLMCDLLLVLMWRPLLRDSCRCWLELSSRWDGRRMKLLLLLLL